MKNFKFNINTLTAILLTGSIVLGATENAHIKKSYLELDSAHNYYDTYCDDDYMWFYDDDGWWPEFDYENAGISVCNVEDLSSSPLGVLITDTTKAIDYKNLASEGEISHLHLVIKNNTKHKEIKELLRNCQLDKLASITLDFDKWVSAETQQEYLDIISGREKIQCLEIRTNKVNELNYRNLAIPNLRLQDNSFSPDIMYIIKLNAAVEYLKLRSCYPEEFDKEIKLKVMKVDATHFDFKVECELINRNVLYTEDFGNFTGIIDDNTHIFLPKNSSLKINDFSLSNTTKSANIFNDCSNLKSVLVKNVSIYSPKR